jgi:hypothetical protein
MKTFTQILMVIFIFCISSPSFSQLWIGKTKQMAQLKQRSLIVILEVEQPEVVKKLTKKKGSNLVEEYRNAVATYNNNLKEVIEKIWIIHPSDMIIYKSYDEVDKLRKTKSADYAVLYAATEYRSHGHVDHNNDQRRGLAWSYSELKKGTLEQDKSDMDGTTCLMIKLIEKFKKPSPAYRVGLPNIFPRKSDLTFGVENINNYMSAHFNFTNDSTIADTISDKDNPLKSLTLVLRYSDLKEKFSPDDIPAIYPYKYQLLSDAAFDELIVNKRAGFAYAIVSPTYVDSHAGAEVLHIPEVVEASTGRILCKVPPAVSGIIGNQFANALGLSGSMGENKFDEHFFKSVVNYIAKY